MKNIGFEKAMEDLENIVRKLEAGGLPLNESLALFEKGIKLARFLRQELESAEKKIEILLRDEKGEMKAEPFKLEEESFSTEEGEKGEGEEEPPF